MIPARAFNKEAMPCQSAPKNFQLPASRSDVGIVMSACNQARRQHGQLKLMLFTGKNSALIDSFESSVGCALSWQWIYHLIILILFKSVGYIILH